MIPTRWASVTFLAVLALGAGGVAACSGGGDDGTPADPDAAAATDAADDDATVPPVDARVVDAPVAVDAAPGPVFATFRIDVGRHDATITGGDNSNPIRAFQMVGGRDYLFAFNPSAAYTITNPVEPSDQLDWNKLPGLSDCGTVDLSVNGAMFGWRWRLDTTPRVLEVTAYANNNSAHLWLPQPLFTMTAEELALDAPLRYRVWLDGNLYRFSVQGMLGARAIDVTATHPRICPNTSTTALKWAGQFYFGGTSTAPSVITARVSERAFAP